MDEESATRSLRQDLAAALAQIALMRAELDGVSSASAGSNIDDEHDPEGATVAFERAQLSALLRQAKAHVADVEAALARIARGSYGRCERCGQTLPDERLEALPAARRCVACAVAPA